MLSITWDYKKVTKQELLLIFPDVFCFGTSSAAMRQRMYIHFLLLYSRKLNYFDKPYQPMPSKIQPASTRIWRSSVLLV